MNKEELLKHLSVQNVKEHVFTNIELKRSWSFDYGKKISALCNKQTSDRLWCIIGVEDNGILSGHDEKWARSTELMLSQQINSSLDPSQSCLSLSCEYINGSWVIMIQLMNPGVVVKWDNKAYKASGTSSLEMMADEIMELTLKLPGLLDFSKQQSSHIIDEKSKRDLSNLIRMTNEDLCDIDDNDELLKKIHFNSTNAERILIGETKFRIVKLDSEDNILQNSEVKGLLNLISDELNNELIGFYRITYNIDNFKKILRESFGNAVAHAAYNENSGEIILELYPDRFVISNLFYPEYKSFANKWFSLIHKSPNVFLMEILRTIKKVDELGKGKSCIFRESVKCGFNPPIVEITHVGRYNRWSLNVFCGHKNERIISLLVKIESNYQNKQKSLVALALILWNRYKVTDILKHFGEHELKLLTEVLTDIDGPIYYYKDNDEIVLNRWVRVFLSEGKESKQFTPSEEDQLYNILIDMSVKYYNGYVTLKDVRRFGHLSESNSDKTLSSLLLKKWHKDIKLDKIRNGVYKFTHIEINKKVDENRKEIALKLLEEFEKFSSKDESIK